MRATTPVLLAFGLAGLAVSAAAAPPMRKAQMLERMHEFRALEAVPAAASEPKSILVDCTKGDSLQTALAKNPGDDLVFEVRGLCAENVKIERRRVTLRGLDPATDGVRGVAADPAVPAALQIWHSEQVRLENLSFTHTGPAPAIGLGLWYSAVRARNCRMNDNPGVGIHASGSGFLDAADLTISNNAQQGLRAQASALAFCVRCQLHGNTGFAAAALNGGILSLLDSVVTGSRGLQANLNAYADIDCVSVTAANPCSLNVTRTAAFAGQGGQAAMYGAGPFAGQLSAFDRGEVYVYGAQQTATGTGPGGNPLANNIGYLSTLIVEYAAENDQPGAVAGNTLVHTFSRALFVEPASAGTVNCSSAGDAWRDPAVTGTFTNCEHAPPPAP